MKLLDEAKYLRKDAIYEDYYKIIKNFKDYDKITTKKMLETIIDLYNQEGYLKDFLTIEEIDLLKMIIKNKRLKEEKVREHIAYESLSAKLIIRYDHTQKKYNIPEEFKESVEQTIKKLNKTDLSIIKDNTNFEKVFLGIIKIFGVLTKKDLYKIVYDYTKIDADEFDYLINLPLINYHFIILKDNVYTCADYYLYLDEAIELISKTRKLSIYERPIEDVVEYGYHDFLLTEDSTIAFLDKLDELHLYPNYILKRIKEYCNLNLDRTELKEHLADLVHNEKDYQELCILLDNMMNNTTSIAYQGRTPNEYQEEKIKEKQTKEYNKKFNQLKDNEDIIQYRKIKEQIGSAIENCCLTYKTLPIDKFKKVFKLNNIDISKMEPKALTNLLLFHSIDNEPTEFSKYIKTLNVLSSEYATAWKIDENQVESVFQIKDVNSKKGVVIVEDAYTNKEYEYYDIAFSCSGEFLKGLYIYTTLVKVDNIWTPNEYLLPLAGSTLEDINEKIDSIKGVNNLNTRRFLACYLLSLSSDTIITKRTLS